MSKYVIKNCPCYTSKGGYYDCWANQDTWCENIIDCVMKQIVSRLNNFAEDYGLDAGFYADELLSYLDIQEVE